MKFSYNNRIIEQLGTELITSNEVAITEIIKNSYDAGARNVNIHFLSSIDNVVQKNLLNEASKGIIQKIRETSGDKSLIVIEDNGKGMNLTDLQNGFFTIGSDYKKQQKEIASKSNNNEPRRIILGDKGLGRLATQRLAPTMFLETLTESNDEVKLFQIEWPKLILDNNIEIPELSFPNRGLKSYTRIWLSGTWPDGKSVEIERYFEDLRYKQTALFEEYGVSKEEKIVLLKENLQTEISFLYSPFEVDNTDFRIQLWYNEAKIKSDFHNTAIDIAEAIHSFELSKNKENDEYIVSLKMDIKPWYLERVHLNLLGKDLYNSMLKTPHEYAELLQKYKTRYSISLTSNQTLDQINNSIKNKDTNPTPGIFLKEIAPIEGKVYSFKRDNKLLDIAVTSAIENNYVKKTADTKKIRPFLDFHNGIKLYRDKFRIANIGNKNSDWLKLQQARTKGQQFYRFELGNVIGYIKINDFYQEYIKETSSRQEIRDSEHKTALLALLEYIFNDVFYKFTKSAYEISRDILDEEGFLPKNNSNEIKDELKKSESIIKRAQSTLAVFKRSFKDIEDNISLDDPKKIQKVQSLFNTLKSSTVNFDESIEDTVGAVKNSQTLLKIVEQQKKNIELETYNNYKLMANGLITEVLTHELHSILVDTQRIDDYKNHVKAIESYLIEVDELDLFSNHLVPINEKLGFLYSKMSDLNRFYLFLEKTFLYKGTVEDYEIINVNEFLTTFEDKIKSRLKKNKIDIDYTTIDNVWNLPKGSLTHIFYNLIDNSIYWIGERQRKANYDKSLINDKKDFISIKRISENEIHFFDSGTGVLPEIQHTLFHPLVSGRDKGRGMGLYIVKKFLESFDANIELLSDLNQYGNRYIFSITYNYDSGNE